MMLTNAAMCQISERSEKPQNNIADGFETVRFYDKTILAQKNYIVSVMSTRSLFWKGLGAEWVMIHNYIIWRSDDTTPPLIFHIKSLSLSNRTASMLYIKVVCVKLTYSSLGYRENIFMTHNSSVIMGMMASQITSLTIVYSTIYSGTDERKTSKLRVTGHCEGNSQVTGEFPAQRASNAKNVSI